MGPMLVILYAVEARVRVPSPGRRTAAPWTCCCPRRSSRLRVLLEKAAAMVLGTALLAAALCLALVVEGRLFDMVIPADRVDRRHAAPDPARAWCSGPSRWR